MRQLPHLEEVSNRYRGRGLHVLHVEAQNHEEEAVRPFLRARGVTFPNAILSWSDVPVIPLRGEFKEWGYDRTRLPMCYLVGVDGTIVYAGPGGYEEALEQELAKVRYPGLFRREIAPELEEAARAFADGRYAAARSAVEAARPDLRSPTAAGDAEWIVARVAEVAAAGRERAETQIELGLLSEAIETLHRLVDGFNDQAIGDEARRRIDDLRTRPETRDQLAAREELWRRMRDYQSAPRDARDKDPLAAELRRLAEVHPDSRVATEAREALAYLGVN